MHLGVRLLLLCAACAFGGIAPLAAAQRVCLLQLDAEYGPCLDAPDAVTACSAALRNEPRDFRSRAGLCEAYVGQGDYASALSALEAGKAVHRGDGFLLGVIDRAISNVREKSETSVKRPPDLQTLIDYMVLRCVKLKNAAACDDALEADPGNREALAGKADLLLAADDPVGAIQTYRRALAVQDDADMRARLAQAESRRRERVSACLGASRPSALDTCTSLLIAGEDDEHELYATIGDLEASRGSLSRALDAYESARRARATRTISARIDAVSAARRCISSSSASACVSAHASLPDTGTFASVRAEVSLAGCRALLSAGGGDAVQQAGPLCDEARQRVATREVGAEIDRLMASASQAPPPDRVVEPVVRPAPEKTVTTRPAAPKVSECLRLASEDGVAGNAIAVCEMELADAGGGPGEAKLAAALAELERRRDVRIFEDYSARCLDAGGAGMVADCERALAAAPRNADTAALRQRLASAEQERAVRPRQERLARLRSACMQFSLGTLDDAESACAEALELQPDDGELTSSLSRVRNLIGANRNSPLLFKEGVEAITY